MENICMSMVVHLRSGSNQVSEISNIKMQKAQEKLLLELESANDALDASIFAFPLIYHES